MGATALGAAEAGAAEAGSTEAGAAEDRAADLAPSAAAGAEPTKAPGEASSKAAKSKPDNQSEGSEKEVAGVQGRAAEGGAPSQDAPSNGPDPSAVESKAVESKAVESKAVESNAALDPSKVDAPSGAVLAGAGTAGAEATSPAGGAPGAGAEDLAAPVPSAGEPGAVAQASPEPSPGPASSVSGGAAGTAPAADAQKDKATGEAERDDSEDLPPGSLPQPGGLSVNVGGSVLVGQSTFQRASYARNALVAWSGGLGVGYRLPDSTRIGARIGVNQELTLSDGDDDPQTLLLGDTGLSVARLLYNFEDGPQLFGSLSATIPTSKASRVATLVTSLNAGVSASQNVGPVALTFGTRYRKNFHRYTSSLREREGGTFVGEDGVERPISTGYEPIGTGLIDPATGLTNVGGNQQIDVETLANEGSNNTSMSWSNSLSLFYMVESLPGLGLSAGYSLGHSWAYEGYARDELSGVGAESGVARRDRHGGSIGALYFLGRVTLSMGMSTGGPTRSNDNKRIRFPFFNFDGPESNMTTFSLGVTLTESIPL